MNTKYLKFLAIFITICSLFALLWLYQSPPHSARKLAQEGSEVDFEAMTTGQKQKWLLTQQINLKQTTQSLLIDTQITDKVCAEYQSIQFIFAATEVAYAGESPDISLDINCEYFLQSHLSEIEVPYAELRGETESSFKIERHLIYSDEPFPTKWRLNEIRFNSSNPFTINTFEIQKVHGHNFEFDL